MASLDEILSIVTAVLFGLALLQFGFRYSKTGWGIYRFILLFTLIRIAAYSIRAYMDSGAITPADSSFMGLYIAELILLSIGIVFIMKLLARLYGSILPKLRMQTSSGPDLFERCLVERTRFFLLPIIIPIIVGAVYSTPQNSASDQELGLLLRKVGVCLLMALGIWYWFAAFTYRNRYPGNRYAFSIALLVMTVFDAALIYKLVGTFYADVLNYKVAYFVCQPLLELIGLCILSVDLQAYFLGQSFVDEDIEIVQPMQPTINNGYHQSQAPGYYQ
ncbi:hypothetical protein BGX28_007985 [Mortierella sp. GBA30]|nr:hypothetical protein BGX28_007985 [Mortierella sp. GBA30]